MKNALELIQRIENRIMKHKVMYWFTSTFDLINEDLSELKDIVKKNMEADLCDSPLFFPDNQLHLKKGSRILNIRARHILKQPEIIISCMESWEADDQDFGSHEQSDAAYFVNSQEIDKIIDALKEAKRFLNG